jgi:hypothetical protein
LRYRNLSGKDDKQDEKIEARVNNGEFRNAPTEWPRGDEKTISFLYDGTGEAVQHPSTLLTQRRIGASEKINTGLGCRS